MAQILAVRKLVKEEHKGIATVLSFALLPLSGFATDIYIPSLPTMGAVFHVGSIQIQLTLTLFLISYGVGQLFLGSVVDSYGRYKPGLIALAVFILASLIIPITHNIYVVYLMRIIHGLTVGTVIVGKRAYFVDVYSGDKLKHYLSMFSIVWSVGPIIAPYIGGYLQSTFGWEANFYMLAILGTGIGLLEWIYGGETLKQPSPFQPTRIARVYADMLKTPTFTLGIFLISMSYSTVMVFNMTGPFIIEHHFQFSPITAGYAALISGLAWMTGGLLGKSLIRKPFFRKLSVNIGIQLVLTVVMLATAHLMENLYTVVIFAFLIHTCAGFTFNNYFTYCLSRFPKNAGIASGLTGGIMYTIVSGLSYGIVYIFPAKDQHNLSMSYLIMAIISVGLMITVARISRNDTTVA